MKLQQKSLAVIFHYYSVQVFTIVAMMGEKGEVSCVIHFSDFIISVMVHLIKTDEGVWVEPFGSGINAAHHNYKQNPSNETY